MKINYHLLLLGLLGSLLIACDSETSSEAVETEKVPTAAVKTAEEIPAMPTASAENAAEPIDRKELAQLQEKKILLAEQLYELYNAEDPPETYYAEDLVITTYLEQAVEFAEVAFMDWGNGFMLVHADYFNGQPEGGKRFLAHENQLFGVEIIELKTKITESGESTEEVTTYTFYYDNGELIQVWDGDEEAVIDPTLERLSKEHLEHWETIVKVGKRH